MDNYIGHVNLDVRGALTNMSNRELPTGCDQSATRTETTPPCSHQLSAPAESVHIGQCANSCLPIREISHRRAHDISISDPKLPNSGLARLPNDQKIFNCEREVSMQLHVRETQIFGAGLNIDLAEAFANCPQQRNRSDQPARRPSIQIVKPVHQTSAHRERNLSQVPYHLPSVFRVDHEIRLTRFVAQLLHKLLKETRVRNDLAGDLEQDQQALRVPPKLLLLGLAPSQSDCQVARAISRLPKAISNNAQDAGGHYCRYSGDSSPCLPFRDALLSQPPAHAQRFKKIHCGPLSCTQDSATKCGGRMTGFNQAKHTARVFLSECRACRHGLGFWFAFNAAQRAHMRATAPATLTDPPCVPAQPAQLDLFA